MTQGKGNDGDMTASKPELEKILAHLLNHALYPPNAGNVKKFVTEAATSIQSLLARREVEARTEAFDKIFEMAPKENFEHWTPKMIADWFYALHRLEAELSQRDEAGGKGAER